jgi:hypothetical protein
MVILKVFKHVVFSGETFTASSVRAIKVSTILGIAVCRAVTFHVCVKVEGSKAIADITTETTLVLAVDVIAVDALVIVT